MTTTSHYDNTIVALTRADGTPVCVLVAAVGYFMPEKAGTRICLVTGEDFIDVNESPDEVLKRLCAPPEE